jgi:uncharacterized membrane protein
MIDSAQGGSPLTSAADETSSGGRYASVVGALPLDLPSHRWWHRKQAFHGREIDLTDDRVRPNAWVPVAMIALMVAAFLFRFAAAQHLSSHVDEAASVMAAQMVADKGVPLYPSGTLYLQGATLSYILAPVIELSNAGLDDLLPLRMLSVITGTLAVYFAFRLGRTVTGSSAAGFIVALLLAVDPASVRWSGMVRMYASLQLLSLVVIWLFIRALLRPTVRRELAIMVAVFWLGVFTHIAICLFLPAMAIGAALIYGRSLQDRRRDLSAALIAMAGAPVVMLGLNALVAPPNKATSTSLPGISFVGDFLFSAAQIFHPSFKSWTLLFGYSSYGRILPAVILACSAVLAGRHFLGEPGHARMTIQRKRVVMTLFLLYWLPIAAVAAVATEQNERYLLHIHPVGLVLVVLLAYELFAIPVPALEASASARAQLATSPLQASAVAEPWRRPHSASPRRVSLAPAHAMTAPVPIERLLPDWLSTRVLAIAGFVSVVVLGAAVRISHLNHLSLWLDEGFTALYSQQTWRSVAGVNGFYSPHPPLFFTLVKVSDLFVSNQLAGRLIAVVAGIATIPVFYLLIAKVLDRRAAFVSSLVLALSPIHLYYSQEARMYSLVVFLIAVSYYALISYHQQPRWTWAALYGVAACLALWVDYSSTYALAPQAVLILVQFYRHRRAAAPLFIAGVCAVAAYLPWIPQVLSSIDAANQVERRESYLGVDSTRIGTTLLAMIGYAGDGSYFQTLRATAWNRYPDSRAFFLLAALPVALLGVRGLWRRWEAMTVVVGLLATMVVGIWVSLISPGFAERTVLTTTLGWAALLGAAFSAKSSRVVKAIATVSLIAVLLMQSSTIDVIYNGAIKQQWQAASSDVALVSPLGFPIVTYSYGAVADTLVDIYQPGLLQKARLITIRDGGLENVLSNGVIPEVGLTRTYDLPAGKLNEALPNTPDNDFVWYLYYTREGEPDVRAAIHRAGYNLLLHNQYRAPRYQVFLDLYARPTANLGDAVPIDATFAGDAENGWVMPASGASVTQGDGGPELLVSNQTFEQHEVFTVVDATGKPTIATFSVQLKSAISAAQTVVSISCDSTAGTVLSFQPATVPPVAGNADAWRTARVSALCPADTTSVRLSVQNLGEGDMSFRQPTLNYLPIPGGQA